MSVFESLNETSGKAKDIGERYVKSSHQYVRLKVFQQFTVAMSLLGKIFVIGGVVFIAFLFFALSAALAIGKALDSLALGALIVGGAFFLVALVIYLLRHRIDHRFIQKMSHNFFD
ncbi:hypothetical protein [Formosa sp. S-31]|uniref:hypothetical protein n=1 Tax=Formosa sp. S-31 TaxID=2790949 RepID=UPI003EBEACD5